VATINEMRSEGGVPTMPWGDAPGLPLNWECMDALHPAEKPATGRNRKPQRGTPLFFRTAIGHANPAAVGLPVESQTLFWAQPQQVIDQTDDAALRIFQCAAQCLCDLRVVFMGTQPWRISFRSVGQAARSSSRPAPSSN
jgi:hypothetical protein